MEASERGVADDSGGVNISERSGDGSLGGVTSGDAGLVVEGRGAGDAWASGLRRLWRGMPALLKNFAIGCRDRIWRWQYYNHYVLGLVWRTRRFTGRGLWRQAAWVAGRVLAFHGVGAVKVGCWPEVPRLHYVFSKLCILSKCRMGGLKRGRSFDWGVFWSDSTLYSEPVGDWGRECRGGMLNRECVDISKSNVERVFFKVFGYSMFVDPTTFVGQAVEKGDGNALHDGRVIQCPIESPLNGKVYMRLIRNGVGGGMVEDIRVPVFRGEIPFVYLKYRPVENRFEAGNSSVRLVEVEDALSFRERELIRRFCDEYPVEYCELDVLRDRADGRIYIVDVNKTAGGFADQLSEKDELVAMRHLLLAFRRAFL